MHRAVHTEIRPKTGQDIGGGGGIEITETPSLSLSGLPPSAWSRVDGLATGILTHETNFGNTFFGRRRGGFEWWRRLHWNRERDAVVV